MPIEFVAASRTEKPAVAVVAAGALCWRIRQGKLEVLLIHRPRYQDWSWPKGKLDDGETNPEAAVREVREETGLEIRLGIPLPTIHYPVSAGLKAVHYWAAKVDGTADGEADGNEVDTLLWCSPERAFELLTNPSDEEPLEALLTAYHRGELDTWALLVVRHAKAKPRSGWTRAEGDRTLAATGRRQALAVQRMLMAWRPDRVVSSPWTRCIQTITPYVKARKLKIRRWEAITEAGNSRRPKKAAAAFESLFDKRKSVVVCTHRPVLPTVIKVMSGHMQNGLSHNFPKSDPYLAPGEAWVMHVSCYHHGRIVSLEQYKPVDGS